MQVLDAPGCRNAHVTPGAWQLAQLADECFTGRVWQVVQAAEAPGWVNFACANGVVVVWQALQVPG